MKKKSSKDTRDLRQEIADIFTENRSKPFNYRQIIRHLNLHGQREENAVMDIIDSLVAEGKLEESPKGKFVAKKYDRFVEGVLDFNSKGSAYLVPDNGDEDIFIESADLNTGLHNDRVKVCLFALKKNDKASGEVVEVIKRARSEFVGVIERKSSFAFLIADDRRMFVDIYIPLEKLNGAVHGQKVIAKITDWPVDYKNPFGEVVKILGKPGEHNVEMNAIVAEYGFATEFPREVEKEAEKIDVKIPKEEIAKRRDFREITTFTIDPADAKDFDDAISIRQIEKGLWEIGVHIADVSWYVKEDGALDKEALNRGTSVYLVDRTIPMLPEKLSNGVCSLRPKEEKLCFSAVFEINDKAEIKSQWFGKTVIFSDHRFSYEEAQEVIEKKEGIFSDELQVLNTLALIMRQQRFKDGAISFETEEVKFILDDEGKPLGIYKKIRKDAHKLIEDFMLLANKKVAEYISVKYKNKKTFVYRVHEAPATDKLNQFGIFAAKFGYKINTESPKAISRSLNQLLEDAEGKPESGILTQLAIRSMAKAYYTTLKTTHYGLAFDYYTHFTSPIRRYPDLMVHRLLEHYLEDGKSRSEKDFEEKSKHSSRMEEKAAEAERASIRYKQVEYLRQSIGQVFEGIISGVTEWGIYVELIENKCEGMIRLGSLQNDYYMYDEKNLCVIGRKTKKKYQLGDKVKVKIAKADLTKRTVDMELVSK